MASSWYKQFQNDLAAAGVRSRAGTGSLAALPVSTVDTSTWDKPLNGFGDHLLDFGGRVLDVMSRPGYATGSFLNTILRNEMNAPDSQDADPLQMAWKGLLGQNKEFFKPVEILNPYQEGESGLETATRWLGDFGASLLTDPTSYIGAGAISKVGKLTKLDELAQGIKDAAKTTNVPNRVSASSLAASDLATDTGRLRDSLDSIKVAPQDKMIGEILGAAKSNVEVPGMGVKNTLIDNMPVLSVNDTANKSGRGLIDALLAEPNLKMGVVGDLSSPVAQQGVEKIAKNLKYRTGNPEADLAMFTILRTDIAQNLRKIRGRLYSKGEFDSPWEDRLVTDAVKRPEPKTFPEIAKPEAKTVPGAEIPGTPIAEQANRDASIRYTWETMPRVKSAKTAASMSKKDGWYVQHGDNVYFNGEKVGTGLDGLKTHMDQTVDYTNIDDINHEVLGIPLGAGKMTVGQYASALKQGVPKPFLADSPLGVRDDITGLNDYITQRAKTYAERSKNRPGESTVTQPSAEEIAAYEKAVSDQAAEKAAYDAQVKAADEALPTWETVRPDAQSRREWINKHRDKLTDSDRKKLNEALYRGSQHQFDKLVDNIIERETQLDITAVDDLERAVKDGRVSKEEADKFYALFNAKNASGARNKIASIDKTLSSLKEKLQTKIRETAQFGADNVPLSRKEAIARADAQPIPVAKTPMKFFEQDYRIKRETFDSSAMRQFVEAVKDVVEPEVLGKIQPAQAELLHKSIRTALSDKFIHDRSELPLKTNRMRTNNDLQTYNTFREFNEHKQYTFWKNLIGSVSRDIPKDLRGPARASYVYDQAMPVLKAYDQILRSYGIHPSITAGGKGLPLSLHDVLSALPRNQAEKFFFNKAAEITPQQWLHIAEEAFYSKIDETKDIATLLLRESDAPLSFAGNAKWVGEQAAKNTAKRQAKKGEFGPNFDKEQVYRGNMVAAKTFGENLNKIITPDFARQIKDLVAYNSRRAEIQTGQFVRSTSDAAIQKFVSDISQVRTQQELFSLVENASKGIAGFTKDTNMVTPPGAVNAVKDQVDLVTRSNPGTEIAIREQNALRNANTVEDAKTAGQNATQAVNERLDDMIPEFDFSRNPEYRAFGMAMHHLAPHMQEGMLRHIMLSGQNIAMEYSKNFSRSLSDFERSVGYDRAKQIWSDIQAGIDGPAGAAEYGKMHQIISETFDVLRRSGIDPEHLNSNLGKYQLNRERFALRGKNWEQAYDSWKHWGDLEDPLNVLSRFYAAAQKTRVEKEMFDRFSLDFGSKVPKPGYGRIVASKGGSRVAHLIDTRMYYPQEVIQNLHSLDQTMKELAKPSSRNKLIKTFDEVTHKLKSGLTIYRPGHHMRNAYGDAWLNFMDGVVNPSYYKKAWGILATRGDHYSPEALKHIDLESFVPNGRIVTSVNVNGKRIDVDENMAYLLMRDSGNLPTYSSLEDLGAATTYGQPSKVNEGKISLTTPTGGRAHKVATTVSEVRDHYFRAAHFVKLLEDTKSLKVVPRAGESFDQAARRALLDKSFELTARVRKFHPDGTDLQRFERNGLKRGILFYSWIRKMIPLVIETTVMNPGRALAFPKATYTLAEAQGIDLNGLGDPFPADQLFPAWMGGTQGPVAGNSSYGYIGMRPGNPMMDIFDQYLSSPGQAYQTIIGATHPMIKMPYELATGATTQGVPINDLGKYALGQVPFGSLVNTLAGKPVGGVSASDQTYDPNGIRDPKALALINTLTGLGLIDMSKPSYVKTGEFDVKYGRTEGP